MPLIVGVHVPILLGHLVQLPPGNESRQPLLPAHADAAQGLGRPGRHLPPVVLRLGPPHRLLAVAYRQAAIHPAITALTRIENGFGDAVAAQYPERHEPPVPQSHLEQDEHVGVEGGVVPLSVREGPEVPVGQLRGLVQVATQEVDTHLAQRPQLHQPLVFGLVVLQPPLSLPLHHTAPANAPRVMPPQVPLVAHGSGHFHVGRGAADGALDADLLLRVVQRLLVQVCGSLEEGEVVRLEGLCQEVLHVVDGLGLLWKAHAKCLSPGILEVDKVGESV
mmetsp:Transcript_22146/g.63135  ORF Transcript_22146/g.63135 Transcript_22146/m.63135 type:complete len:278 (+) Transcript_22146:526-1359(+)